MEKNKVLSEAFTWLFIGLLICFGVSYVTTLTEDIFLAVYGLFGGYGYIIYLVAEIAVALFLSIRITKLAPTTAKVLYLLYTALTGLSLGGIFLVYTSSSLAFVFLATAIVFGIFAVIGKTTNLDLSKWYVFLFVGLLAIIVLGILNIFINNPYFNMVTCIAGVLIFCAYTAYDIQMATRRGDFNNSGIFIAFNLFLDFINIFIELLRLFGKSRD